MFTSRPSETISGIVGTVIGAILVILGSMTKVVVPTEAAGAIIVLVSYIAWAVTAYVARRQRAGELPSAPDGAVRK
jgi:hypothetical protein